MNKQNLNTGISLAIGLFIAWIGTTNLPTDTRSTEFWYQFFIFIHGHSSWVNIITVLAVIVSIICLLATLCTAELYIKSNPIIDKGGFRLDFNEELSWCSIRKKLQEKEIFDSVRNNFTTQIFTFGSIGAVSSIVFSKGSVFLFQMQIIVMASLSLLMPIMITFCIPTDRFYLWSGNLILEKIHTEGTSKYKYYSIFSVKILILGMLIISSICASISYILSEKEKLFVKETQYTLSGKLQLGEYKGRE